MIAIFKVGNNNTLISTSILLMILMIVKDYNILIRSLFKFTLLKSTQ